MNEHTLPSVCTAQSHAYAHWLNASPKQAFLTAALATLVHPAASFVEGWVCLHWQGDLLLWEHAWCQTPTGILDPTLAVFPSIATPLSYHPGTSYNQADLWQRWQEGVSFPLTHLWVREEKTASHPSYAAAFTAASAHAHSWRAAQEEHAVPPAVVILAAQEQPSQPPAQEQQTTRTRLAVWQETVPLSQRAKLHVDASLRCSLLVRARAGACYQNSALCACMQTRRTGQRTTYVEGWLLRETEGHLEIVEHAWCEREGEIIEPTLPFLVLDGTEHLHFFAGARLSYKVMEATLIQYGLPWVKYCGRFGTDGSQHQGYQDAFNQALAVAVARKQETEKPILLARSNRGERATIYQITVEDKTPQS